MMGRTRRFSLSAVAIALSGPAFGVTLGQLDTFTSGETDGWRIGIPGPNPSIVASGGPEGQDDAYLRYESSGFSIASRLVVFNDAQWTGDYLAEGVAAVRADVLNLDPTEPLDLRLAFGTGVSGKSGTWWVSTDAVPLPPLSGWQPVEFPIDEQSLTRVAGSADYASVLGGVGALRLLSAAAPSNLGDRVVATLGVDNLRAIPAPGDYNGDGVVDPLDLEAWRTVFGAEGGLAADGDFNNVVDAVDYTIWRDLFSSQAASSVPEPGATAVVIAGCAAWVAASRLRGRRNRFGPVDTLCERP